MSAAHREARRAALWGLLNALTFAILAAHPDMPTFGRVVALAVVIASAAILGMALQALSTLPRFTPEDTP